jgi:L-lactate dehydrogenase complex protein LldG
MKDQFRAAAIAAGCIVKSFSRLNDAVDYVTGLSGGRNMVASRLPAGILEAFGEVMFVGEADYKDAALCVSFALAGIAETGSLLLDLSDPVQRSATALPPVHIVLLMPSSIVPDLFAMGEIINCYLVGSDNTYLSLTTGPSRTADIERVLTIGVHGPSELHVLIPEGE